VSLVAHWTNLVPSQQEQQHKPSQASLLPTSAVTSVTDSVTANINGHFATVVAVRGNKVPERTSSVLKQLRLEARRAAWLTWHLLEELERGHVRAKQEADGGVSAACRKRENTFEHLAEEEEMLPATASCHHDGDAECEQTAGQSTLPSASAPNGKPTTRRTSSVIRSKPTFQKQAVATVPEQANTNAMLHGAYMAHSYMESPATSPAQAPPIQPEPVAEPIRVSATMNMSGAKAYAYDVMMREVFWMWKKLKVQLRLADLARRLDTAKEQHNGMTDVRAVPDLKAASICCDPALPKWVQLSADVGWWSYSARRYCNASIREIDTRHRLIGVCCSEARGTQYVPFDTFTQKRSYWELLPSSPSGSTEHHEQ
jgi:hypothetical protein